MQRIMLVTAQEELRLQEALEELFALRERGEDYSTHYAYVRRITEELVYYIPQKRFLAEPESCSSIYLDIYDKLDRIIFSYRISKQVSYIDYLTCVLKNRIRSMYRKQKKDEETIYLSTEADFYTGEYTSCPDAPYYLECFERLPSLRQTFYNEYPNKSLSEEDYLKSLGECYQVIVNHAPAPRSFRDRKLTKIYNYLKRPKNRRDLLVMLLTTREDYSPMALENLAMIFDVSPALMARLETMRHEKRTDLLTRENEIRKIRNHHWLRYIALANACEREEDPVKKKELQRLRDGSMQKLHNKCESLKNNKRQLTVRALSKEISLPPSTISKCVRDAKTAMSEIIAQFSDV